jgi:anti-sigma B factor antagonist
MATTDPIPGPTITQTLSAGRVVLRLAGEFDLASRATLEDACRLVQRHGPAHDLVVDLSAVEFVDCASLRTISRAVRTRQAAGGGCTVLVTSPFLLRLLEVSGLGDGLPVVTSRLGAVA